MPDDITKARTDLMHAKQERQQKAAEFWDRTIVAGQQTEAGRAIQREQLKPARKAGRRVRPSAGP
jgi:hypothetical protein